MHADPNTVSNQERPGSTLSGWPMLLFTLLLKAGGITLIIRAIIQGDANQPFLLQLVAGLLMLLTSFISWGGFFSLQPNESRVLILFGAYKGTARRSGFHWVNPS